MSSYPSQCGRKYRCCGVLIGLAWFNYDWQAGHTAGMDRSLQRAICVVHRTLLAASNCLFESNSDRQKTILARPKFGEPMI
jgi:hypothetical protein